MKLKILSIMIATIFSGSTLFVSASDDGLSIDKDALIKILEREIKELEKSASNSNYGNSVWQHSSEVVERRKKLLFSYYIWRSVAMVTWIPLMAYEITPRLLKLYNDRDNIKLMWTRPFKRVIRRGRLLFRKNYSQ